MLDLDPSLNEEKVILTGPDRKPPRRVRVPPLVSVITKRSPAAIAGYAHPYHSHYEGIIELERPWKYYQQPL